MNGYRITINRLTDHPEAEKTYDREQSVEVYDQKVETLDVQAVIAVINGLEKVGK